jgi:hypothetical protein
MNEGKIISRKRDKGRFGDRGGYKIKNGKV